MKPRLIIMAFVLASVASPARASQPRLLVASIECKSGKLPDRELLEAVLVTAVRRAADDVFVLGMDEIADQIELEADRQRLGYRSESCLAEIAGATGAEQTLFVNAIRSGRGKSTRWHFQVVRADRKRVKVLGRSSLHPISWDGDGAEGAVLAAVAEVFRVAEPLSLKVVASKPRARDAAGRSAIVSVNVLPWGALRIDGERYGDAPVQDIELTPGEHTFEGAHPRLGKVKKVVQLKSGQNPVILLRLQKRRSGTALQK